MRLNDTNVCLIDSGSDEEAGRKVRQVLDKNGWRLTAIYNAHSNADHIGGNHSCMPNQKNTSEKYSIYFSANSRVMTTRLPT